MGPDGTTGRARHFRYRRVPRHFTAADGSVRIGALATWAEIAAAGLPPAFDGLRSAARAVGGLQVQNRGTIAGNLCTASPAGDGIPCLMSLDARVELASVGGRRRLPIEDFVTGYRSTALAADEIVTSVIIPTADARRSRGVPQARRPSLLVISIAMVAGTLAVGTDGGSCGPGSRSAPARLFRAACGHWKHGCRPAAGGCRGRDRRGGFRGARPDR